MRRHSFSQGDLAAIAIGGIAGSSLRWAISQAWSNGEATGGWFEYEPNTSVSFDPATRVLGFDAVSSSQLIGTASGVAVDTLMVNLSGCLLLGVLAVLLGRTSSDSRRLLVGAATGLCGSLTTFSTFAVEAATLLRGAPTIPPELTGFNARFDRDESSLLLYLALSVIGGGLAFWIGRRVAQRIVISPGEITIEGAP